MASSSSSACRYDGPGGSSTPSAPEPWGGQVFCPVTGAKLGVRVPAILVETPIGAKAPSPLGKLFGRKPTPGMTVYVCCSECVAKVRAAPESYLGKAMADRAAYAGSYAQAPANRSELPDAMRNSVTARR